MVSTPHIPDHPRPFRPVDIGNLEFENNFKREIKSNEMAVAVIVDNKAFITILKYTRTQTADLLNSQGIIYSILALGISVKDISQATSLGRVEGKGNLSKKNGFAFEGEGVQVFAGVVFNNNSPTSVINSPNTISHINTFATIENNNVCFPVKSQNPVKTNNRFAVLNPETSLEEDSLRTHLVLTDAVGRSDETDWGTLEIHFDEIGNASNVVARYVCNMHKDMMDVQSILVVSDPTEKSGTITEAWTYMDLAEAFIQVLIDDVFNTLKAIDVDNAINDVGENICLTTSSVPVNPNAWILDSGANVYICNNESWFTDLHTFETTVSTAGQGSAMHIAGGGTVQLEVIDGDGDSFNLVLNDVAYAPASRCNLISISKLAQAGVHGSWGVGGDIMQLLTGDGYIIGSATLDSGLYHLKLRNSMRPQPIQDAPFVANVDFTDPVWKEHRRLGHLSLQRMIQLCTQSIGMNVIKGQIQAKIGQICPVCATTRAIVRMPRDPARIRYDEKGQLVHVDIWGPYPVVGWDGTRWMVFSTDDATRATKTLRLKTPAEFPQLLRELHKKEERKYQTIILRYRVDNQFNQGPWKDWCKKKGIAIEPIAPHTHHQVGVAERVNRTLREGASAMIQDNAIGHQIRRIIEERGNEFLRNSTLPETLWPEAIDYAAWLKNRISTRALKCKKTPWELEEGNKPDLSREKIWGSRVYVSYTDEERGRKLYDPRGWLGYFVGCENESIYRVWDPSAQKVKRVVYTTVEDGQGLDDTHEGQNVNDRVTRQPL